MRYKSMAAALFASVPLVAAAQSNITIYGLVDAGIVIKDVDVPGQDAQFFLDSGNQNSSRIGFRGTEDLGRGLKALFNLELGVGVDTGVADTPLFQRRAVVGVESEFGILTLGREYSPVAAVAGVTDILGQGFYGTNLSGFGTGRLTRRLSNSINVRSKAYSGLTGSLTYSAGENPVGASGNLYGLGLEWAYGPFYVGGAFQVANRVPGDNDKEWIVGAGWKYQQFEVKANFMSADPSGPANRFHEYNVGASMELGPGKVFANFQQDRIDNGTQGNAYAVAGSYALSRRTNLYASYGTIRNNGGSLFGLYSASNILLSPTPGGDPWAVALGVRHSF